MTAEYQSERTQCRDAQKGLPARPQRARPRGVHSL